ncbi:nuclear transport factor 2 family protein [Emticicia sp. 21SJ11W-3]|uniref:nuclear transport factor 2 family protein n=1 Tax=Emticicia sp. 21SJ11W-3 TaxID=2916755 RepID=UPI00209D51C3|nr:nuclear transport factor 2 family protein [Emticicia sp. 21SJ11W-3]UTA69180.1 nuclear transport factor 2 family protein [Emticicia sp. 21SJ11W-3]
MKFNTLLLAFIGVMGFAAEASAQTDDEAIKATLYNYLDGGATGDSARLNRAFHPAANLRSQSNGRISEIPVKKFIASVPAGGAKWKSNVVSYSFAGTAGTAVTEEEFENFKYVDFLNLLKINGEWKIVSRVFSKVDKTIAVTSSSSGAAAPSTGNLKAGNAPVKKPAAKPKPSDDGW